MKAQDDSSPLMCCHLVSTASRHCQMLGYHRESTYKEGDSNANDKRRLFWTLYTYDKSMSLLLGRASYIQDFDIDVKLPPKNLVPKHRPWDEAFVEMIKMSEIGGNVYNKLYSATASKASFSERISIIQDLKSSLEECRERRYKVNKSHGFILQIRTYDFRLIIVVSSNTTSLRLLRKPLILYIGQP